MIKELANDLLQVIYEARQDEHMTNEEVLASLEIFLRQLLQNGNIVPQGIFKVGDLFVAGPNDKNRAS